MYIEEKTKALQRIYNVIEVRMLAQKRNKIMYKNILSIFFKFPIGHPPTSKVFLDFWNLFLFTWPLYWYCMKWDLRNAEEELKWEERTNNT